MKNRLLFLIVIIFLRWWFLLLPRRRKGRTMPRTGEISVMQAWLEKNG